MAIENMFVGTLYQLLNLAEDKTYGYEIIRRSSLAYATVYKSVKALTEMGLIEKENNPDRRRKYLQLTEKGQKVLEGLRCLYESRG